MKLSRRRLQILAVGVATLPIATRAEAYPSRA